jgi:hypothetical protein
MTKKEYFAILKEFGSLDNYTYKNGEKGDGLYLKVKKQDNIKKLISLGLKTGPYPEVCSNPYGMINFPMLDNLIYNSCFYKYQGYQRLDKIVAFWFFMPKDQINHFFLKIPSVKDFNYFLEQKRDLFLNELIPAMNAINSIEDFYEFSEPLKYRVIQRAYYSTGGGDFMEQWRRLFVKAYVKAPDFIEHLEFFKSKCLEFYEYTFEGKNKENKLIYLQQLVSELIVIYNNKEIKTRAVNYCKGEYDILPLDEIEELDGKIQKEMKSIEVSKKYLLEAINSPEDGPEVPDYDRKETKIMSRKINIIRSEESIDKYKNRFNELKERF